MSEFLRPLVKISENSKGEKKIEPRAKQKQA